MDFNLENFITALEDKKIRCLLISGQAVMLILSKLPVETGSIDKSTVHTYLTSSRLRCETCAGSDGRPVRGEYPLPPEI